MMDPGGDMGYDITMVLDKLRLVRALAPRVQRLFEREMRSSHHDILHLLMLPPQARVLPSYVLPKPAI